MQPSMKSNTDNTPEPVRVVRIESEKIPETQYVFNVVESKEPPRIVNITVHKCPESQYVTWGRPMST